MIKYEISDPDSKVNLATITIQEGQFSGISYKYGIVSFDETEDKINFTYNILDTRIDENDKTAFEDTIFEILCDIIIGDE